MTLAKSVCAWCGRVLRDGPEPISHGLCDPLCQPAIDAGLSEGDVVS